MQDAGWLLLLAHTLELCEALAERANRYGYAMIGIADTPGNAMDPWVSAAMVARASRRARVALCVTNLLTRHPAVSAAAIASLDHVANGRAVLGIGAGHSGTRNVGLQKSRAKDLAEGVTFIRTLLRGEPAALGTAAAHLPWIKRAPPVFLAASHPKPLQAAGATADGAFANFGLAAENIRDPEKRRSWRAPRPPAARRTTSRFGRSPRSTATRTATPRAARLAPCLPSSPAT